MRTSKPLRIVVPAALLSLALAPARAQVGIAGSPHDFAPLDHTRAMLDSDVNAEGCMACHVPRSDGTTPHDAPAWVRAVVPASWEPYATPDLEGLPDQPRSVSKLCLGCHDGTVAVDSFDKKAGMSGIAGGYSPSDVSSRHPISAEWEHPDRVGCANCHSGETSFSELRFFDGRIECATCHDPHGQTPANPTGRNLLRLPMFRSALCRACHLS